MFFSEKADKYRKKTVSLRIETGPIPFRKDYEAIVREFYMKKYLLMLCVCIFCCTTVWAAQQDDIEQLEDEMLIAFNSKDRNKFFHITDRLKEASKEVGDERMYYTAWGYQGIYESTQQNYRQGLEIAQKIKEDARENGSIYGEYAAMHTEACILLQKQEYEAAEETFLNAVEFHHRHYPSESAAQDLLELMTIADHRKDDRASARYARQIVREANVDPAHKGRALYHLSQTAFDNNDKEEFNRIYNEMSLMKESEGFSALKKLVEVNYYIINGDYQQALQLSDQLEEMNNVERKALIYHRMGNDSNAYKYMLVYKHLSDSITQESHSSVVSTYFTQMNDDRMKLEQHILERENHRLHNRLYATLGILTLVILLFFILRGYRIIRRLRQNNRLLVYERKDAERALTDLNELSFFESKTELTLTTPVRLNKMCDRLADATQALCYKGVTVMFLTDFPDNFEMKSEPEALKKLLTHLLHYAARFTDEGFIKLSCSDAGDNVLFCVTDTSAGLGTKPTTNIIGMFSEQGNKIRYVGMNFNICQSITRLLLGRIWYDSEYTNGTRFYCEMPKDPNNALNKFNIGKGEIKPLTYDSYLTDRQRIKMTTTNQ